MQIELLQTIKPQIVQSAECIQAMLVAALPLVNGFLESANTDLSAPVTTNQVQTVACRYDSLGPRVAFTLTNGWAFACQGEMVAGFSSPHAFTAIEDFGNLSDYFGPLSLSRSDAIERARKSFKAMGFDDQELFYSSDPIEIEGPRHEGRNVVPYYLMTWSDPRGNPTVSVEINGTTGKIQRLDILAGHAYRSGWLDRELSSQCKPKDESEQGHLNPEFLAEYLPTIVREGSRFLRRINQLPRESLETNEIALIQITVRGAWPMARVTLLDGSRFALLGTEVYQFDGSGSLWNPPPEPIELDKLTGDWRLSERESLRRARDAVRAAGFDLTELGVNRRPAKVKKPLTDGSPHTIPRYQFRWERSPRKGLVTAMTTVEINADTGELEGITVQDFTRSPKPLGIAAPILKSGELAQ